MASSNICWGIELGAGAVKALKLERRGDELRVLDFAVVPHKRVLSTPELDQDEAMRVALGTLVSQHDLSKAQIAVSVPGHAAFARFAKLPPVEKKKIPDIVKFEAVQQIPFPIEEVEWDYQTFQSPDSPDVEVGIFAMTRERVMSQLTMLQDVGLNPSQINLSPVAVYNAAAWDWQFTERTPGTVIVDIGTTSTDLIVSEAGRVWVRTFALGGHRFTEALVDQFKLSYQKAERLKREAEQSKHARHVFQAMRPVFSDLAQEIQRSLSYYEQLHRDANLTRLIGFGSTFQLPGLRKYLTQQLQVEVVRQDTMHRISVDGPRAQEFNASTLILSTAYGMALQGLGMETIRANLMPMPVLRQSAWKKKRGWFAAAAGLALLAGGASFAQYLMTLGAVQGETPAVVNAVQNKIGGLKREWNRVQGTFGEMQSPGPANALSLVQDDAIVAHLLQDVGAMLAAGEQEAARDGGAGFEFGSFDMVYSGGDPGAGRGMQDPFGGGGGRDERDDRGGREAPVPVDDFAAGGAERRISLEMELRTRRDAASTREFVTNSVVAWLLATERAGAREGVPFTIEYERWEIVDAEAPDRRRPGARSGAAERQRGRGVAPRSIAPSGGRGGERRGEATVEVRLSELLPDARDMAPDGPPPQVCRVRWSVVIPDPNAPSA